MQTVVDPSHTESIITGMKIGLISDVHGDLKALNRALNLLHDDHNIETIWCAGDLVGRGKYPDEVVARIITTGIPTVMGNHDEMTLILQHHALSRGLSPEKALGYSAYTLHLLTTLPRTYRVQIEGRTVVMVHGTPRSNNESVSIKPAERNQAFDWLEKIGADILITGHTHVPMVLQDYRGLIVNPGSLFDPRGFQRSSSETYGVLDVSHLHFAYYPLWD